MEGYYYKIKYTPNTLLEGTANKYVCQYKGQYTLTINKVEALFFIHEINAENYCDNTTVRKEFPDVEITKEDITWY